MRLLIPGISVIAIAAGIAFYSFSPTEASPAEVIKDTGCLVRDGDGNQTFDPDCKAHIVFKFDKTCNLQFIHYQDKGRLPEGAPRPDKAQKTQAVVTCGGCLLEGTYEEITTPSGHYSSSGPN